MKIVLQNKAIKTLISIETPHNDPDKAVIPKITGDDFDKKILSKEISEVAGFYGHIMNIRSTTNLDLYAAVRKIKSFQVFEQDPKFISQNPLPEGCVS